ncbi:hypothetical protein [Streptomyces noursei]|uniref:Uncharacterized protein n=1 Tax=Streptomyces noursei TaxID=1971 RepID=A0A2N8PR05_STRNR|nr:hypothetical protein [Streptomyces noursei]PNE43437.1 hypothetical protein AOB60_00445 [Streptomyces noursei]
MLTRLVVRASVWAADYRERLRKAQSDRGDISITTVIIWAAAIGGAIVIAGTIAAVVKKYDGKLGGV